MALTYKQSIIQKLNEFCFHKIWNEVVAEYKVNIRIYPLSTRYVRGSIITEEETITLPIANTQFMVYSTSDQTFFGGLYSPRGTWVNGITFIDTYKTLLYLYQPEGKLIPRSTIYIYRSNVTNRVYIAILKKAYLKVFGVNENHVYLTVYRDSNLPNDITCRNWYINPSNVTSSASGLAAYLSDAKTTNLAGTTLLINGVEKDTSTHTGVFYTADDYIEVICDRNVIGSYTVNVSNNSTGYSSTRYSEYREILHCPKAINPSNKLITHNTCTISVIKNIEDGRYLHRTDDTAVGQITHNDISVATSVIEAFREYLDTENVTLKVRVRVHDNDNILLTDLFYINMLYKCSDTDILGHLRGTIDSTLTFWKASALEDSTYIKLMFDTPNSLNESILDNYVNGMGYYAIASILSPHVYHTVVGNKFITINKPIALLTRKTIPCVYLNGRKLRSDKYTYSDPLDGAVRIKINDSVYCLTTDTLSIVLLEDGSPLPYEFIPISTATTITVPFKMVSVYEEITLDETQEGYVLSSNKSYRLLNFSSGVLQYTQNTDGTTTVIAGPSLYNKKLYVHNAQRVLTDYHIVDDDLTENRGAIVFPIQVVCENNEELYLPPVGYKCVDVYINGYKGVYDLDYTVRNIKDDNNNVILEEIVISSLIYFDASSTNNYVEVVMHTSSTISTESGYAIEEKLSYDKNVNTWSPNIGTCFVNGKLSKTVEDHGTYLVSDIDTETANPYDIRLMIPGAIGDILSGYNANADSLRLKTIWNYFNRSTSVDTSFVIINNSYKIYSPYLAEIIKDIITDIITPVDDPDDERFLGQFDTYNYLKERDPAFTDPNTVVNKRFVDIAATHYTGWTVVSLFKYKIIHRLVMLTLNDENALGDING